MTFDYSQYTAVFFLHTPKNAGTFLSEIFKNQNEICYEYAGHEGWDNAGEPLGMEINFKNKKCGKLNTSTRKLLKIATIRNPFDLLVSIYFHEERGYANVNSHHDLKNFEMFLEWYCDPKRDRVSSPNWAFDDFLYSRIFSNESKCLPDVLIRFEFLEKGIKNLFKNLNIEMPNIENIFKNTSERRRGKSYQKLYSSEARKMVETACFKELDIMGYDFYGPTDDCDLIYPSLNNKFDQERNKLLLDLHPLYKTLISWKTSPMVLNGWDKLHQTVVQGIK